MMTYIITGASGFIGYNLADYLLKKSFNVVALVNKNSNLSKIKTLSGIETVFYDEELSSVASTISIKGKSCFIHCAWKGVSGASRNDVHQFYDNIPFSLKTIQLASALQCSHWIGLGSQAEYGLVNKKISEEIIANPLTPYACSKKLVYESVKEMSVFTPMKLSWIRVFSVYGPHDNSANFIPYLISCFHKKSTPSISSCEQNWDYLFVEDAVDAIYKLAEQGSEGLYNLGSGTTVKLKEVVEEIKKQMGVDTNTIYGEKPQGLTLNHLEADMSKIQNAITWNPSTSLSEGIRKTINFYTQ